MQLPSNSPNDGRPLKNWLFTRERAILRRIFFRYAGGTLTEFFHERGIAGEQAPPLLTETLDEAVKQFPYWITQVALICHLTSHYRSDVHGYLIGLVGDRQTADDLTQDTFINAMIAIRKGGRVPAASETKTWLFVIATNLVRDASRKRKTRQERPLDAVDETTLIAKETPCVDVKLDLREALDKVKNRCGARSVEIAKLVQHGCSKEEIAARQDVSERTVERHLKALAAALVCVADRHD